jgi:hypothetical protein
MAVEILPASASWKLNIITALLAIHIHKTNVFAE